MKKVVITGSNRYIASLIQSHNKDFEFIPFTRQIFDFANAKQIEDIGTFII